MVELEVVGLAFGGPPIDGAQLAEARIAGTRVARADADSAAAVIAAAAGALAEALRAAISERGHACFAVAGGSALPVLVTLHRDAPELWPLLRLTWIDERCVHHADGASNCGAAKRAGVLDDPAPAHVLRLIEDAEVEAFALAATTQGATTQHASHAVHNALARVAAGISEDFAGALDVTLLGLGEDGHIASLFPGRDWGCDDVHVGALYIGDAPKPPPQRMSLTHALLATARSHIVFAVGASKRAAIARVIAGDPALPLSTLNGVRLFTDAVGGATSTQETACRP